MSDLEKTSVKAPSHDSHERADGGGMQLPPDPDAHLSPEERAQIVCLISDGCGLCVRLTKYLGSQARTQA